MRAAHDLTDAQLAALARSSIDASRADDATKSGLLAEIERWCDTIPT
jgi:adenosine deaminase